MCMNPEYNRFDLYPYYDALSNTTVINKNGIEFYIWLKLPDDACNQLSLFEVIDFNYASGPKNIDFSTKLFRENHRPWIRLESSMLNLDVGYHIFRFRFVDIDLDDYISFYFSYAVQDDNPDKPYMYMTRDEVIS